MLQPPGPHNRQRYMDLQVPHSLRIELTSCVVGPNRLKEEGEGGVGRARIEFLRPLHFSTLKGQESSAR